MWSSVHLPMAMRKSSVTFGGRHLLVGGPLWRIRLGFFHWGRYARAEANQLGRTIEKTIIGNLLVKIGVKNRAIWAVASATFAANARKGAQAVIRKVKSNSHWRIERAILRFRGIDPIYR